MVCGGNPTGSEVDDRRGPGGKSAIHRRLAEIIITPKEDLREENTSSEGRKLKGHDFKGGRDKKSGHQQRGGKYRYDHHI